MIDNASAPRLAKVKENLLELLAQDVSYPGWNVGLAQERCFYVRGITWFKSAVLAGTSVSLSGSGSFIAEMKAILASRTRWQGLGFNWGDTFAARQLIDAASYNKRATPKFQKAVESIVLCEAIAVHIHAHDASRPPGQAVYDHMRIEPAASYINGFTPELLRDLLRAPELADQLRAHTGQTRLNVFYDMAAGQTVTHTLAVRLYERVLKPAVGTVRIDPPEFRYDPARRKYQPAKDEEINVKDNALPPRLAS